MKRKTKTRTFLLIIRVMYAVAVVVNLLLPITTKTGVFISIMTVLCLIFYTYGMLGSHGYFKRIMSESEEGEIRYDTPVPIVQIGIVRGAEFLVPFIIGRNSFLYKNFLCLVVLDILFIIILLLDKNSGYYVSVKEED